MPVALPVMAIVRSLAAQSKGQPDGQSARIPRRAVDARNGRGATSQSRFIVVLRLEILFIGQVIDREVEIDRGMKTLAERQIDDIEPGGTVARVLTVQTIAADVSPGEGRKEPALTSERHAGIGNGVGRTIDIHTWSRPAIEGIGNLCQTATNCQIGCRLGGESQFVAGCPARAEEFEAAIIRDVDLFIRMVDQETAGAEREPADRE